MKSFLIFVVSASLFGFEVPPDVKAKYAHMYQLQVQKNPDGTKSFGNARLLTRKGIHVLSLEGDRFEMAFQHGRLLQNEIKMGALPEAADSLKNAIYNNFGNIAVITGLAVKLVYKQIPDRMFKAGLESQVLSPDKPVMEAYGLSEGSGLPFNTIVYGATGPESLLVLLGIDLKQRFWDRFTPNVVPSSCSSLVADKSATRDGEMLIGRNTDYPLNGYYDRFPLVTYYRPTDGTQKYMSVTSVGLHNAGVVGYNESGIYLDVHTVPTTEVNRDGVPVFMIAQEVLRNAKTFDEAIALFHKSKRPAAGWTYVLVSTRERKAASIELTAQNIGVRLMQGDSHVQTNHFSTPGMLKSEVHVNLATDTDTIGRYQRIEAILKSKAGALDEKGVMAILGDKFDVINGETRAYGNVVGVHTTMTSVVLHPKSNKIYVANGTAPVSLNEYVEFPLGDMNPNTFLTDPFQTIANDGFKKSHPNLAKAEQHFINAKIAYESKLDYRESLFQMEQAVKLDPSAGYRFVLAVVAWRAEEYAKTVAALKELTSSGDLHYKLLAHYYLGRISAKNKQKADALASFKAVYTHASKGEEKLIKATQKAEKAVLGHAEGFLDLKPRELPLMMQQGDMVKY